MVDPKEPKTQVHKFQQDIIRKKAKDSRKSDFADCHSTDYGETS